jgi:hypothetical protein
MKITAAGQKVLYAFKRKGDEKSAPDILSMNQIRVRSQVRTPALYRVVDKLIADGYLLAKPNHDTTYYRLAKPEHECGGSVINVVQELAPSAPDEVGHEPHSPEVHASMSPVEKMCRDHFNEPVLTYDKVGRVVGYAEDAMDCYIVIDYPDPDGRVYHTCVGGYIFLDNLKKQSIVHAHNGELWNDFTRLDNFLAMNGAPQAEEFVLDISQVEPTDFDEDVFIRDLLSRVPKKNSEVRYTLEMIKKELGISSLEVTGMEILEAIRAIRKTNGRRKVT